MVSQGVILSNRYLLQEELGAGGMSVVYKSVDLRTAATVAVKIPHAFLLRDSQYLERLKREAQIAATVQSSRIAIVTDVSEHEGTPYFVMEYVAGDTLSDILVHQGALAPVEALRITLEVGRAMDAAHERGVVHRDLKPHNIRLTRHGDVKVMDFGIARVEGNPGLTSASLFLGTPDYCAPERAEGPGDIRSDIYSIGIVLFEMLCGKVPFRGGTPWSVIQMHTAEPPPPLPETLPPAVRAIVARCLAKNPDDRYQTPRELVDAVQAALRALEREGAGTAPAGAFADTAILHAPLPSSRSTASAPNVSAGEPSVNGTAAVAAPLDEAQAMPLTSPPGPKPRRAKLLPLIGGVLALLALAAIGAFVLSRRGGDSATISVGQFGAVKPSLGVVMPTEGARISGPVTVQLDVKGVNLKAPAEADPDGRHIHYFFDIDPATVLSPGLPIPTGQANIIHTASAFHTFVDVTEGTHTVWAVLTGNDHVPLDPMVLGKVSFIAELDPLAGAEPAERAPIAYEGLVDNKWQIFTVDNLTRANQQRLTRGNANDFNPAFSPDRRLIAFTSDRDGDGTFHIFTINLDGSDVRRITTGITRDRNPAWSPDGKSLVYTSDRRGTSKLWIVSATGGEPRQLTEGTQSDSSPSWSRDGRIVYASGAPNEPTHIWSIDSRGGSPKQLTVGPTREIDPAWSPDGKKIAFARSDGDQWNIWTMNADGSDQKKVTNSKYNIRPSWSPDAKQILYNANPDEKVQQLYVVSVDGGAPRRISDGTALNRNPSWPVR